MLSFVRNNFKWINNQRYCYIQIWTIVIVHLETSFSTTTFLESSNYRRFQGSCQLSFVRHFSVGIFELRSSNSLTISIPFQLYFHVFFFLFRLQIPTVTSSTLMSTATFLIDSTLSSRFLYVE